MSNNSLKKEVVELRNWKQTEKVVEKIVFKEVEGQTKVIEKKVVEIQKVYVPVKEYIKEYIGDSNETCKSSDELIRSIVY